MGSGASKGKRYQESHQYGELYLQTDKTTYQPGETVTGTIYLDITSQYPGHQLFLKLKGREIVHFLKKHGSGKNWHYTEYSETKEVIKQNTLVYSWDASVPQGQFTIPFSFLLPSHLPASFYQHEYKLLAFIEYQLEAFLEPPHADCPKMKYKQPITIREAPLANNGDLKLEVTTPLKSCCCCNQGSNVLKAEFEKKFYSPEEEVKATVELDNSNSKMNHKKLYIVLIQKLELKAQGETVTENMFKRSSEKNNYSPSTNKIYSESFTLPIPKYLSEFDYKLEFNKYGKRDEVLRKHFGGFSLYNFLTPPTKGSLISSTFSLKVYSQMDGIEATLPELECPVSILIPDSPSPMGVTAPSNWRPVIIDRINVAFSSEHQNQHTEGNVMEIQGMPGSIASTNQVRLGTPLGYN